MSTGWWGNPLLFGPIGAEAQPEDDPKIYFAGLTGDRVGEGLLGGVGRVFLVSQTVIGVVEHVVPIALVERSEGGRIGLCGGDPNGVAFEWTRSFDLR
jgi:hypothetical protein